MRASDGRSAAATIETASSKTLGGPTIAIVRMYGARERRLYLLDRIAARRIDIEEAVLHLSGRQRAQPRGEQLLATLDERGQRPILLDPHVDDDQLSTQLSHRLQVVGVDGERVAVPRRSERCFELVERGHCGEYMLAG